MIDSDAQALIDLGVTWVFLLLAVDQLDLFDDGVLHDSQVLIQESSNDGFVLGSLYLVFISRFDVSIVSIFNITILFFLVGVWFWY